MSISNSANPLADAQRETVGAKTFEKYSYQYHWALSRILKEHHDNKDFVIFIEYHEDVILASSQDSGKAVFEFNQIKNVASNKWKVKDLIRIPKGSEASKKNSIIGKMLKGIEGKLFREKIEKLNLVATCGFNLEVKNPALNLSVIYLSDLTRDCISSMEEAISKELGGAKLPEILSFVLPDLQPTQFQNSIIGEIATLVENKHPNIQCSAVTIYRILIDELQRKGMVTHDYKKWEDLILKKGLTSGAVAQAIESYSSIKNTLAIDEDFRQILADMKIKFGPKLISLRQAFGRYKDKSRFERSAGQLEMKEKLRDAIKKHQEMIESVGMVEFLKIIATDKFANIEAQFSSSEELQAAILYELITMSYET